MKDYFLLSFRNLKRRGLRSWLTVIGIFIGIAAVVALISLGQALQLAISSQFASLEPDKIQLKNAENGMAPPGSNSAKSLTQREIDLISNVKYINAVYGTYLRPVTLNYNGKSQFTFIQSLPSKNEYLKIIYRKYKKTEQGDFLSAYQNQKILLGNSFLTNNIFGKEIKLGDNIKINNKEFRVIGFLEKSGSFAINQAVYLLDVDLEDLLNLKKNYDLIEIYVEDQKYVDEVANEIKEIIRKDRKEDIGEESFSIDTPSTTLNNINTVLIMVNAVVITIASIALLIGGIGVANTMFTSIVERKKEIGIMKAIGAKNKDILKIFLIESGLLGFFGGLAGALFGLTIAYLVSNIATQIIGGELFKVMLSWPLLIGASFFSFIIGLIAGYIPAKQASKLNPVQALRG